MKRAITAVCAACLAAAAGFAGVAAARTAHHRAHHPKKHCVRRHHRRHCTKRRRSHHTHTQPAPTGGTPSTTPPGGTTTPPPQIGHLQVTEREFSIVPSRTTLAAGTVAVELDNRGQDPHNLRIERADTTGNPFDFAVAQPGSVSSRRLDLAPGTWKLYCTLAGHEAAGMHALITVTG